MALNTEEAFRIPQDLGLRSAHQVFRRDGCTVVSHLNQLGVSRQRVLTCAPTLVYVRTGTKHLHIGDSTHDAKAGQLVLFHRGLHLMTEVLAGSHAYESVMLSLNPRVLSELAKRHPESYDKSHPTSFKRFHILSAGSYLSELFEGLPRLMAHAPDPRLMSLKVQEVFLALQGDGAAAFWSVAIKGALVEGDFKLRSVVERHYQTPVSTAELATLSGRSLSSFKRDFSRLYGGSPGRWLLERRLERARQLLASHACNVTEACWQSGFEDVSSFIRAFKRVYDMTPKHFQASHIKSPTPNTTILS